MSGKMSLLQTAERRREVIQLREAGATWEAIAETMETRHGSAQLPNGWDRRYAYNDWKRELDKIRDDIVESTENVRQMELRRINRMLRGIWPKATGSGQTTWKQQREAIDRVIRLQKRRAKLEGLDEPEGLDLTSGGEQIQTIDFRPIESSGNTEVDEHD